MAKQRILVTGMSGLIGSAFREAAAGDYQVSALNRREIPGVPTTQADLADFDAMQSAFSDVDVVVHLAAVIHDGYGWEALLNTNVIGTRHVFEAALHAGVKRVVFISSGATVAGWERTPPYSYLVKGDYDRVPDDLKLITEDMAPRPANLYAATKVWGESIARHYADNHGLEVICLRIGYANEADRPEDNRQRSVWNSQRDVVQAIRLSIDHKMDGRYECFFITSDNERGYRDLSHARKVLDYEPHDKAGDFS